MWFFTNNSTYVEDAASLLIRTLAVAPNNMTYSTETLVENFIIRQMLSPDPDRRLSAHVSLRDLSTMSRDILLLFALFPLQRQFALLWQFLRYLSNVNVDVTPATPTPFGGNSSNNGSESAYNMGSSVSGWRRIAMGLPPITNEIASNVGSFNR